MNKMKLLTDNFVFLEGPRWHNDKLYVSDMWGKQVYSIDMAGHANGVVPVANRPSGIGFMSQGTMLISSMADKKVLAVDSMNVVSTFCELDSLCI